MTFSINRRGFMAGGASLLALSGMGAPAFAQDARLRLIWWGSQPFDVGLPERVTRHNRQLSLGFVIHF